MTRIAPIDPKAATGKAKELLDQVQKSLGLTPNMMRAMAQSPAALEGYLKFSGALAGGALSARARELIALAVAEANSCQYCASAHSAIGKMVGLADREIASGRRASSQDPKIDAILKLAHRLVVSRGELSDAEIASARRAGVSDGELAEIVAHVALNVFTNYFNITAGTPIDFPEVAPVGNLAASA